MMGEGTAKLNAGVEVPTRPIQFLVTERASLRLGDAAQIKPGANHALKAAPAVCQYGAHLLETGDGLRVNAAVSSWHNVAAINPPQAVVLHPKRLRAVILETHRVAANCPCLDG